MSPKEEAWFAAECPVTREVPGVVADAVRQAVAGEREACARLAERGVWHPRTERSAGEIAAAIRGRAG